jgi:aspartate kinase
MEFVIQKYGGTSVGKADRMLNVAGIVKKTLETNRVAVVVSAMSSYIKAEGTTNRLLEAADAALNKGAYFKIIDQLEESHLTTIEEAITSPKIKEAVKEEVKLELKHLKSFLEAIQVIGEISPRSMDVIVGTGEKLSARILTGILNSSGVDAEYVNLDSLIQKSFPELNRVFYNYLKEELSKRIAACAGKVPVVTGYFGFVPGGIIQAIGRGYTDFTAALIAAGIGAKELQIWKEVDGIFSADPRKVENAKVLPTITPEEAAELTYYGSEVIHPFTMEQVINAKIPIRIKNTFNPELPGTVIDPNKTEESIEKKPSAITAKRGVSILNINSNRMLMAHGFMAKVFNIMNQYSIVIDLISTSEVNISMTLDNDSRLPDAVKELEKLGRVSVDKNMAILSLVGNGMQRTVGTAGKMFSLLANAEISIEMISQGASEINISCVIPDELADKAIKIVHEGMLEG